MSDVRLTATNPVDSSVVPVACNEKGELKLEEPILVEGPQGEKGEKGDKGDPGAPGADGDPFSGNFTGPVVFDGNVAIKEDVALETLHVGGSCLLSPGSAYFQNCYFTQQGWQKIDAASSAGYINPADSTNRFSIGFGGPGDDPTGQIFITSESRVGIGMLSPRAKLEVGGELVIQSRNASWRIVESGGVAMLIEEAALKAADLPSGGYPDAPSEARDESSLPLNVRNLSAELTMVEEQLQLVMERLKMVPESGWEVWDGES